MDTKLATRSTTPGSWVALGHQSTTTGPIDHYRPSVTPAMRSTLGAARWSIWNT